MATAEAGSTVVEGEASEPKGQLRRPLRVLLCPDRPGWAFDNIATNIIRYAPDYIEVSKFYLEVTPDRDLGGFFEHVVESDVDVIHFLWREDLFELLRPDAILSAGSRLGVEYRDIIEIIGARALTTSVYDHLHLAEERVIERALSFHLIDAYSVSSRKLQKLYAAHPELPPPDALIPDGVDLTAFGNDGRSAREVPVIGWVGNSAWGKSQGGDPKGYHRLYKPALEILARRGLRYETRVADPQVSRIPFEEMPAYYRDIDVLACTSAAEGTPNPVLEAMASGVPVVATDVGIVPEVFGPLQSQYIVENPTAERFADALQRLLESPERRLALSRENLAAIKSWSWEHRVQPWWGFWMSAFGRASEARMNRRRAFALAHNCMAYWRHSGGRHPREKASRLRGKLAAVFQ